MQLTKTSLQRGMARVALLALLGLLLAACHLDMYDQPKYKALQASDFFADGASARPLVDGTVARDHLQLDETSIGRVGGDPSAEYIATNPLSIDESVMTRGAERYKVYCVSCHGAKGDGKGLVAGPYAKGPLGLKPPPLFDVAALKQMTAKGGNFNLADAPDGYYFDVISHGVANPAYDASKPISGENSPYTMFPANFRIQKVSDRWAIIAYIREMQKNPPEK
jgi:cytochrome c2